MGQDTHVVSVEILGLRYPIRSTLDAGYVTELAAYVDAKMHAAAEDTEAADSVKIAVLAALNIADELFRAREGEPLPAGAADPVRDRLSVIEDLLDHALGNGADRSRRNRRVVASTPACGLGASHDGRAAAAAPISALLPGQARRPARGCARSDAG